MKNCFTLATIGLVLSFAFITCKEEEKVSRHRDTTQRAEIGDWHLKLLENNTAQIVGYLGDEKELVIPHFLEGLEIVSVGSYQQGIGFKVEKGSGWPTKLDFSENPNIRGHLLGDFARFSGLEEIDFSDSLAYIDSYVFLGCTKLKSLEFPEKLAIINMNAFDSCISLKTIDLNRELLNLGTDVFARCINLSSVKIRREEEPLTSCDSTTFEMGVIDTIYYPAGTDYPNQDGWKSYDAIWQEF